MRRVSRSLCVRCTPPADRRRRLRMVVPTLSLCAFLRAFAYDMRWSVRCRRWKPMIRRRTCGVPFAAHRSAPCRGSTFRTRTAGFPPPRPLACATSERTGQPPHIVHIPLESTVACRCESDPPFDLCHNIGACVDKTAQIQQLRCLSIPLACCLDDER